MPARLLGSLPYVLRVFLDRAGSVGFESESLTDFSDSGVSLSLLIESKMLFLNNPYGVVIIFNYFFGSQCLGWLILGVFLKVGSLVVILVCAAVV